MQYVRESVFLNNKRLLKHDHEKTNTSIRTQLVPVHGPHVELSYSTVTRREGLVLRKNYQQSPAAVLLYTTNCFAQDAAVFFWPEKATALQTRVKSQSLSIRCSGCVVSHTQHGHIH